MRDIGCGGCRDPPGPGLKLQAEQVVEAVEAVAVEAVDAVAVELPGWFTVFWGGYLKVITPLSGEALNINKSAVPN